MSTSARSPTLKRILREASELASSPSPDYHAAPLESDLFEWHFTLRGPPAPSPFAGGIYHGRIVLPPAYPLKPPSFRFLTPSGRFEVNREICLSISGHHEETWQPAWGIRTALVAIRSFMDTEAGGQLGGMDGSKEMRKRMAERSSAGRCGVCGKTNGEIMEEIEGKVREMRESGEGESKEEEKVPEKLRLAYREELDGEQAKAGASERDEKVVENGAVATPTISQQPNGIASIPAPATSQPLPPQPQLPAQAAQPAVYPGPPLPAPLAPPQAQQQQPAQDDGIPPWIDKAIVGVIIALLWLLYERFG